MATATTTTRRPGRFSRWLQHTANARTVDKIRTHGGTRMGMELLVLHTVGRRSGSRRQNPLAYVDDGTGGWVVVASGGGERHPDWYENLLAHPEAAAVEVHGSEPTGITPHVLAGAERDAAWARLTQAVRSLARYQTKTSRTYPVVRLARR
ncbi:nitroreductase family deazaflavin-dependent oxidoreductase [Isoptericola sp. S6320L]|uniref:nitroreductase family deazaflavin-dependent oxidoreductase n=1 Tax=Isoptericola sp. S6320L TaxID=2926411 RepID=UPI001FF5A2FB|nr:nitroreductase family deazaflavin-dependent oxidoreductase [Isoptericola sp. S6320L]MCK0115458.1 nitroreductase family deazaflavin-dependent oxidoreductase [Isoptericola sp. S6320L]